MKLRYILALTPFLLVGCGEPQPSDKILEEQFTKQYDALELKSVDLTKTEQHGDFTVFAAEGKFVTTENLYENLDGFSFGDGPKFYKLVQKSGETFDFTSTVMAAGNDKAGWEAGFKKLNSKLPEYSTIGSKLNLADPKVLVINAEDFQQKMDNIDNVIAGYEKNLAEKNEALTKVQNDIKALKEKIDTYWSTLTIDGKAFSSQYNVMEHFKKELNSYVQSDAAPYKKINEYDISYYDAKRKELYKKYNNYDNEEYLALKAEREKKYEELQKVYNEEKEKLETKANEALKPYNDAYQALSAQLSDLWAKEREINSEVMDIKSDIKEFKNAKERAVKDGFIKA